ncbi:MAG: restriction endonuclease subunit S [Spirochaetota bacterium]|nr:restriction endonuclease subunit S [Spirochaetota bacterium]
MSDKKRGWQTLNWGELATLEYGKGLRGYKNAIGPYPVYGTNGQIGWYTEALWSEPGVIIGRKGAYRGVHFSKKPFYAIDTAFYLNPKDIFDIKWAYYQLLNFDVNNIDSGTAIPSTSREDFYAIPVDVPPLPTQRKIAAILSAYDDLIENNTRRITLLEQTAQLLYREWFVHFRFPGHESVPLVESELGPIPEGWEVVKFSDIVTLLRRGVKPLKFENETFAHYSFPAFDTNRMPLLERGETIRSSKYLVDEDNVLLSKLNPRIPRVWLPFPDNNYRAIASTEFLVLLSQKPLTRSYLFSLCRSPEFLASFASLTLGTSTSHQRVKPQDFLGINTILPTQALINAFSDLIRPTLRIVHNLRLKHANLRATRDLLLPRLISGQLDVSDLHIDTGELDQ